MTERASAPRRGWLPWASASVVLAVVIAIVVVLLARQTETPALGAEDHTLPAGIDQPMADLLALDALSGSSRYAAPAVDLTNEDGAPLTLDEFRGEATIVMFNDDQCTDLCALLAQDLVAAEGDLSPVEQQHIAFVSINANPYYPTTADTMSWSEQHGLAALPNWYYGTGTPDRLAAAASDWDESVVLDPTTRTIEHGTDIFVVDPSGVVIDLAAFGTTESADTAAFGHGLAQLAVDALPAAEQGSVAGSGLSAPTPGGTEVGDVPAATALAGLDGGPSETIGGAGGRMTVLNFWASTCTACISEMPDFETEYRELDGQIAFIGIDVSDPAAAATAFASKYGITYPLVVDPGGAVAATYRITGLPYTVILDADGQVLVRHPGDFTHDELDAVLRMADQSLGGD